MFERVGRWLAALAVLCGRKYIRAMRSGEVFSERYFPVFVQDDFTATGVFHWKHRLPNLIIHRFPGKVSDDYWHDHGRWACSIILKGGYTEARESGVRVRRAPCVWTIKWDEKHCLREIIPGTLSLWIIGWRHRPFMGVVHGKEMLTHDIHALDRRGVAGMHKETPAYLEELSRRRVAWSRHERMRDARSD